MDFTKPLLTSPCVDGKHRIDIYQYAYGQLRIMISEKDDKNCALQEM